MNELHVSALIIATCGLCFLLYFAYCLYRNRKDFLKNLKPGQRVRYGLEEHVGVIIALYINNVAIQDCTDLQMRKVGYAEIKPL